MIPWSHRNGCQLQILSDLHLEVGQQYDQFDIDPRAPYLVLAGDIGRLIDYSNYLSFLARHAERFQKVFLVLGNHEFYETSRHDGLLAARRLAGEPCLNGKVFLLERARYDIEDSCVVVLGCTLHSMIQVEKQEIVRYRIQDFQKIRDWTVDAHNSQHQQDVQWLEKQIKEIRQEKDGCRKRIVVVTHHAPTNTGTSSPQHANNDWSSAFATDLLGNHNFQVLSNVQWWIFGHTHHTTRVTSGKVKIVSNQRGYVLPKAPYLMNETVRCSERLRRAWIRWYHSEKHGKLPHPRMKLLLGTRSEMVKSFDWNISITMTTSTDQLNDAAIALYEALSTANVPHGIFGGHAVAILGGPRASKDVDCVASVNKQSLLALMESRPDFTVVPQTREDYVAFLWSEKAKSKPILVEIFPSEFPGSRYMLQNVKIDTRQVKGAVKKSGPAAFVDVFTTFKGKLRACAIRDKFTDAVDLRWLEDHHHDEIQQRKGQLKMEYVGLAIKRYPELEFLFRRIGVDTAPALSKVADLDINELPPPVPGDVQKGILE